MDDFAATVQSLEGSGNIFNEGGLQVGNSSSTTYRGSIGGFGTVTKVGSGVLTLKGESSYDGPTNIDEGTLRLGTGNALSSLTDVTIALAGTLDLNGFGLAIDTLAGPGRVISGNSVDPVLTLGSDGGSSTFSGTISGDITLIKTGAGMLTLSGPNNTYTGATIIEDGVLQLDVNNALPSGTTVTATGVLEMNGFSAIIGSLAGTGDVTGDNGGGLFTGGNDATTLYSGVISGASGVTKQGGGIFRISGANTYTGTTTISEGTLELDASGVLSDSTDVTVMGSLVLINGVSETIRSLSGAGSVSIDGGQLTTNDPGAPKVFSGMISGSGGLTLDGGTLTLSRQNPYTGETIINAATLTLGVNNALSDQTDVTVNGTLNLGGFSSRLGSLSGGGVVTNDVAGLFVGGNDNSTEFSGVISGPGGLTKVGSGTLLLSGLNEYLGATIVSDGTLQLGNNALQDTTAVTVDMNATLDLGGFDTTIASIDGAGDVVGNDIGLTVGSNTLYSGEISGPGSLTKSGGGTCRITGPNSYTGGTFVSGGTLSVTTDSLPGNANVDLDANLTFDQNNDRDYFGDISGDGSLTKLRGGTVTLIGNNSYTGGTTIMAGALQGDTASLQGNFVVADDATLVFAFEGFGPFGGRISGDGNMTVQVDGILQLNAENTYTGATMISTGTLRLGVNEALSSSTDVTIADGATLDMFGNDVTIRSLSGEGRVVSPTDPELTVGGDDISTFFFGTIEDDIDLTKDGTGTLTLMGENTYSGQTTVIRGRLAVNGSISSESEVFVALNGTLGGTGTVGSTFVSGRIAPGNSIGTLTVAGDFVQQAGSTYEVELNAAGSSDLIMVTGTATIEPNTTAQLLAQPGAYSVGQRYTILNAPGGILNGTYTTLLDNFNGSFDPTLVYGANFVQVVLLSNLSGTPGLTGNQLTLAEIFDEQGLLNPSGDLQAVLDALNLLPAVQLQAALQQIAPEELGDTAAAGIAVGGALSRSAIARMHEILGLGQTGPTPMSQDSFHIYLPSYDGTALPGGGEGEPSAPGSAPSAGRTLRWGAWGMGFGSTGDVDGTSEAEGFRSNTGGATAGLDYRVDEAGVVGVLFGGGWTDVNGDGLSGDANIDSFIVGLYGGHRFGKVYVDGLLAYVHHDIDTSRDMIIGGGPREAEGNHDGNEFDGNLEIGVRLAEGTFEAQPFFGLAYANMDEDGFDETGAGSLNLSVDDATTDSLKTALGMRVAWNLKSSGGVRWTPQLRAAWEHQLLDTGNDTSAAFPGMTGAPHFTVSGVDVDCDAAVVGVGLGAWFTDSVGAFVGYEGRFGDREVDHQGQGGIEIRW